MAFKSALRFFGLCFLLVYMGHSVYAQKFSENSALKILNNYTRDFEIGFMTEEEYFLNFGAILDYASDYNPNKAKKNFPYDEDHPDFNNDLKETLFKIYRQSIIELKRFKSKKQNPERQYLDSIIYLLNLKKTTKIEEIEIKIKGIKLANKRIQGFRFLAYYYYSLGSKGVFDNLSLEKAFFYLHKLSYEFEKLPDFREQRNTLLTLSYWQWKESMHNFYSYERLLITNFKIFELSKKLNDKKLASESKIRIAHILGELYSESKTSNILSPKDSILLHSVFLKLIANERKNNSNNFLKIHVIRRYLAGYSGLPYGSPMAVERSFLTEAILAYKNKYYDEILSCTNAYLFREESVSPEEFQNKIVEMNLIWDLYLELTSLYYKDNSYAYLFAKFDKYLNIYSQAAQTLDRTYSKNAPYLYKIINSYIDSLLFINNKIIKLPYNYYYGNLYNRMYLSLSQIWHKIDSKKMYDGQMCLSSYNPKSKRYLDSLLYFNKLLTSYSFITSATQLPQSNSLWKYRSLLKGELDATSDELERKKEIEKDYLELQKNKAEKKVIIEESAKKREHDEKLIALAQSESERETKLIYLIILISLVPISILLIFLVLQINKRKRYELELTVNNNSIDIHFVKNFLGVLQAKSLQNDFDKMKISSDRMNAFIKLHHKVNNYKQKTISLENEMRYLNEFIQIHYLIFSEEVQIPSIKKGNLTEDDLFYTEIPPMFIQPFIENALEHGIKEGGKYLDIQFEKHKYNLIVKVSNDGNQIEQSDLILYSSKRKIIQSKKNKALIITAKRIILHNGDFIGRIVFKIASLAKVFRKYEKVPQISIILWNIRNIENNAVQVKLIFKNLFKYA